MICLHRRWIENCSAPSVNPPLTARSGIARPSPPRLSCFSTIARHQQQQCHVCTRVVCRLSSRACLPCPVVPRRLETRGIVALGWVSRPRGIVFAARRLHRPGPPPPPASALLARHVVY